MRQKLARAFTKYNPIHRMKRSAVVSACNFFQSNQSNHKTTFLHDFLARNLLVLDVVLLGRVVCRTVLASLAGSDTVGLGIALPEILLSSCDPLDPWRQEATGDAP